jgi:transcriptional regulator with XRE-family HTH domain
MLHIGQQIKKAREWRDYKIAYIAEQLDVSAQTVGHWEFSGVLPTDQLQKICAILNISLQQLLNIEEHSIFNTNNNQQGGNGIVVNNGTAMGSQERDLYERMLAEKDKTIKTLEGELQRTRDH